ncbi:hypothetical protein BN1110_04149 [bacterium YEK0313]|nr:hypothetical protein BN1110_04149 [bacterium YEK0313]
MNVTAAATTSPAPALAAPAIRGSRLRLLFAKILLPSLVAVLILPFAAVAVLTAAGRLGLPYELAVIDEALPGLFRAHMLSGALALLLVPAAIGARPRHRLHRTLGRAAAIAVLVGGLTALPVALASVALPTARAGFVAQGVVWLGLLGIGWRAIRRGDAAAHRRAMLCLAAVTSAALWLRPAMVLVRLADWPFDIAYAAIAWGAWLLPLTAVAALTFRRAA